VVKTDGTGRFAFALNRGDQYRLRVRADGYYSRFGEAGDTLGPILRVDEIGDPITLRLFPAPSISGRVTDPDGEPVVGLPVLLLRSVFNVDGNVRLVEAATTTDESGYYTFTVPPGRNYFVVAGNPHLTGAGDPERQPNPRRFAWTFYPGVDDPELAAPIDLAAGNSYPSAHLIVSPVQVRQVAGRVVDTRTGEPPERARVDLWPTLPFVNYGAAENPLPLRGVYDPADGTFAFSDVADGRYRASVIVPRVDPSLDDPASEWKVVSVAGRDLDLGLFEIPRSTSLSGRATLVGGASLIGGFDVGRSVGPRVLLGAVDDGIDTWPPVRNSSSDSTVGEDGRFELPNVLHGRYRVSVSPLPENAYIERVQLNGIPIPGVLIEIPYGLASVLDVEINLNGGEIHARLSGDFGEGAVLAAVLLPDPIPAEVGFYRRELVFGVVEGSFVTHGVPPGRYQLFVWDLQRPEGDPQLAELRQRPADAAPIDIEPGERSTVDVRLLED
jgi:hypothetical protein